jgi:hypothetical protein
LQYIGPDAFQFNKDGTVSEHILSCCTVEGDAAYLPSEDNPHFILVKVPMEGEINENTELVVPNRYNEKAVKERTFYESNKRVVPVTLRQILELEKKHGKCFYIDEKWELRGEELYNAKEEKTITLDTTVFIYYFFNHGGSYWQQNTLSSDPPAPLFGYRGWKYLSEEKRNHYNIMADVFICTVNEGGGIDYDYMDDTSFLGTLDIFSSANAFNLINEVDSEAG